MSLDNIERLTEFLYILARDELPIGAIEGIMSDHVTGGEADEYCNVWLEAWARNMAERLTNEEIPVINYSSMYKPIGSLKTRYGSDAKGSRERPSYPVRACTLFNNDE